MKTLLTLLALALVFTFTAPTATAQKQQNKTPSPVQKDIDAIKKMEAEIAEGFLKGNADAHDKYTSQNMRFTGPDGTRQSRDGLSISLRNGSLKFTGYTVSDLHVMVFIDTAIVTYDTDIKGTFNGTDITGKARWTDTWARINGNWLCVAVHGTDITERK